MLVLSYFSDAVINPVIANGNALTPKVRPREIWLDKTPSGAFFISLVNILIQHLILGYGLVLGVKLRLRFSEGLVKGFEQG